MEEPDLEELEWMACEQCPPEDDADAYFDDFSPQPEPPVHSSSRLGDDDGVRKRLWSNGDSTAQCATGEAAVQDNLSECHKVVTPSQGGAGIGLPGLLEHVYAAVKKNRTLLTEPPQPAQKNPLAIPPLIINTSLPKAWGPPLPPPAVSTCRRLLRTGRATSIQEEKPRSPPPPPSMEEACAMSPPREQEGDCAAEVDPPIHSKLPHRRAADIDGEYISITGTSGERVYAAKAVPRKPTYTASFCGKGLLSEPIEKMIERLEREMFEQVISANDKKGHQDDQDEKEPTAKHEDLWVEKYAPKFFTELLSDEQTNREVLRWLKQWDPCVFGGKIFSTSDEVLASLRRQATQTQGIAGGRGLYNRSSSGGLSSGNFEYRNGNMQSRRDDSKTETAYKVIDQSALDRPEEKVLLLCGPPGLGKTTLAHVAAKHCGYRVVEINASDDRVATSLQGKILDAIQMKSVMGDNRPNCLVIDEIDGALSGAEGKGAIDALIEIINAEKKLSHGKETETEEGITRKTSRKKEGPAIRRLSRPVICICNDLYAPALRSLRQVARVHVFVQPSTSRVVSRLKHICSEEGYKTNARALSALAAHTECDVRSCLNTLQFLNRKKQNLKTMDVASQVVGRKDMTSSIFDIWGEVFHKKIARQGAVMRGMVEVPETGNQEYKAFARLYGLFSNHGDFELSMDGIHENILHMRYHDASLHKTVEALEWMGDSEIFGHRIMAKQQFPLLAYQPAAAIAVRRLVAQPERPQVEWPRAFQKCRTEKAMKTEMLSSWLAVMTASVSRSMSAACLALDMVTPLLSVLTPPTIRPVAAQLLTPKEKEELIQLVDTMIGFGISYKRPMPSMLFANKSEIILEGQSVLMLEPPLDMLVKFNNYTAHHRQLSTTLRQMIGHEVDLEKIRREGALREAKMGGSVPLQSKEPTTAASRKKGQGEMGTSISKVEDEVKTKNGGSEFVQSLGIHTAKSEPPLISQKESIKPQVHRPTNFFERFKKSAQTGVTADVKAKEKMATLQRDSRPLLYKFHEGFTNAVKRPMLMRDFL